MWFDNWSTMGAISKTFSYRGLYDARLSARCCVKDMIVNGHWSWPEEWGSLYPNIVNITVPQCEADLH